MIANITLIIDSKKGWKLFEVDFLKDVNFKTSSV